MPRHKLRTRKRKPTSSPPDNRVRSSKDSKSGNMATESRHTMETSESVGGFAEFLTREALPAALVKALTDDTVLSAISLVIRKSIDAHMEDFNNLLRKKDEKILELEGKIAEMRDQQDSLEQYERRNSLRLKGVPEFKDENTDMSVIKIATTLNVTIEPRDISRSHRVGKPSSDPKQPRTLLVKFSTYRARESLFEKRKEAKGFFITEDLTKSRDAIFYRARQARNEGSFKHVWCRDGRIKLRMHNDKVHTVNTHSELVKLLP